ncbi:MAG: hypothetical protein ACI4IE_07895, partial [Eubacterium sp.]
GSGKSTFSRKLREITKIDLYNLDTLYWNSDGSHIQRSEFIEKQEKIISGESWIIDGNFRNTLEMRIKNADLVFFLDLPTQVCINGAINRGERPELPCKLPVNDELIDFIKNFNTDVKPKILELFNKYNSNVITFKSHRQADDYYLIEKDLCPEALELQYEEVKAVKWADCDEIKEMISQGKFIPYYPHFIETLFSMKNTYGSIRDWRPGD